MPPIPKSVIAIIGTTGIGKSDLAIALARRLNGEVVNTDALQVYKGLDIATAKVTPEEQADVPHHLLSFVDPTTEYSVLDFMADASRAIDQIHARGRVPILVGGTHYYTQMLLMDGKHTADVMRLPSPPKNLSPDLTGARREIQQAINNNASCAELHRLLKQVDPPSADRWHPNDSRKITRSLKIFVESGQRHSDVLKQQQQQQPSMESTDGQYRSLVFWLHTDAHRLKERLGRRVDLMLERGLLQELHDAWRLLQQGEFGVRDANGEPDYCRGILQAIGFKEFDSYFRSSESDTVVLQDCVEALKTSTRRYAKKQLSWISNKFRPQCASDGTAPALYLIDPFQTQDWIDLSARLSRQFMANESMPPPMEVAPIDSRHLIQDDTASAPKEGPDWRPYTCDLCAQTVHGSLEWSVHQRSKRHQKMMRLRKRPEWEFYQRVKMRAQSDSSDGEQ